MIYIWYIYIYDIYMYIYIYIYILYICISLFRSPVHHKKLLSTLVILLYNILLL